MSQKPNSIPPSILYRDRHLYYPTVFPELLLRSDFWPSPSSQFRTISLLLYTSHHFPPLFLSRHLIHLSSLGWSPVQAIFEGCFFPVSIQPPHKSPISLNIFWDHIVRASLNHRMHAQLLTTSRGQQEVVGVHQSKDNLNFFHRHSFVRTCSTVSVVETRTKSGNIHLVYVDLQVSKWC